MTKWVANPHSGCIAGISLRQHARSQQIPFAFYNLGFHNPARYFEAPATMKPEEQARREIDRQLEQCGWVRAEAARLLGLPRRTLANKITKLEIQR